MAPQWLFPTQTRFLPGFMLSSFAATVHTVAPDIVADNISAPLYLCCTACSDAAGALHFRRYDADLP